MAVRLNRSFSPADGCSLLNIKQEKARKLLRNLLQKNMLLSDGRGAERIRSYKLAQEVHVDSIHM
ncbi:hypothetical protein [Paenibacillus sp. UNC451MF]|uniref:hypothetical protein n=1 Tax=Paenibacillus sp. UNC451MF TaxID=1449063 RepID=UPI0012DEF7B0|nr:hypothetical protein [Paenibacillus sp. UNC451MF]